jgi:hypothetical protein
MRSAQQEMFHSGNWFDIEVRFRRGFNIYYGIIRKFSCQMINYSETQDIASVNGLLNVKIRCLMLHLQII